ncbi:MAG: hypothetical protein WKF72_03165 [Nocardioidaceae bacterium]
MGHDIAVHIPYGVWRFTIAEPVEDVAAGQLRDRETAIHAPEGSSIIGVRARPDVLRPQEPLPPYAQTGAPAADAALLVNDEEIDLGIEVGVETDDVTVYVVVPSRAGELSLDAVQLRLSTDGQTQTIAVTDDGAQDDFGPAATLYEPLPSHQMSCNRTAPTSTDTGLAPELAGCSVSTGQYPYHPDLGWAGDGATWTWVSAEVTSLRTWEAGTGEQANCSSETATAALQLDGRPPDQVLDATSDTNLSIRAVFRSEDLPRAITLNLVYGCVVDLVFADPGVPAALSATFDILVELPWV